DSQHRFAAGCAPGTDRIGTRRGRDTVALRRLFLIVVIVCVAAGCNRSGAPAAKPKDPDGLSVTRWTDKTELFAEYPPLAAGSTSRFAIHLTSLDTFKPLTEGNVQVRLEGGGGQPEI